MNQPKSVTKVTKQPLSPKEKPKAGRPSVPDDFKKRPLNLTLTPKAKRLAESKCSKLGIKTLSEFLEKFGLDEIDVIKTEQNLEKIEIFRRLEGFVNNPIAVFSSVLGFSYLLACLYGLDKEYEDINSLVCEVIKKANGIIFSLGYVYCDKHITNPSALMLLIIESLLYAKAKHLNTFTKRKSNLWLTEDQQHLVLWKSNETHKNLSLGVSSGPFIALKRKALDQMTLPQITMLLNLQKENTTEEEVRTRIKRGLAGLREYRECDDILEYYEYSVSPEITAYCQLLSKRYLRKTDRKQVREHLLQGLEESCYDFWLNEVHYHLAEKWNELSSKNFRLEQQILRSQIEVELSPYLNEIKTKIDGELLRCESSEQIWKMLLHFVRDETGITNSTEALDLELLLRDKPFQVYKEREKKAQFRKNIDQSQKSLNEILAALKCDSYDSDHLREKLQNLHEQLEKQKIQLEPEETSCSSNYCTQNQKDSENYPF